MGPSVPTSVADTADEPEATPGVGHNSVGESPEALKSGIARIEYLDEEIRKLNESKSDVYAELKAMGFDPNAAKWIVRERRLDPQKRAERDDVRDLYARALGMRA